MKRASQVLAAVLPILIFPTVAAAQATSAAPAMRPAMRSRPVLAPVQPRR